MYLLPIGGLYATYHLLGEPETTIDDGGDDFFSNVGSYPLENFQVFRSWSGIVEGL